MAAELLFEVAGWRASKTTVFIVILVSKTLMADKGRIKKK